MVRTKVKVRMRSTRGAARLPLAAHVVGNLFELKVAFESDEKQIVLKFAGCIRRAGGTRIYLTCLGACLSSDRNSVVEWQVATTARHGFCKSQGYMHSTIANPPASRRINPGRSLLTSAALFLLPVALGTLPCTFLSFAAPPAQGRVTLGSLDAERAA